jgi:urea transport system substrate-binding protein
MKYIFFLAVSALLAALSYFIFAYQSEPIKIGILHSLTGSLAISEKPMVDAELLAIEEINAVGGIRKRKIVPVIVDGKSDEAIFAQEAERLITQEKVTAIIGCWTSACRKAVKPIIEKHDSLLIYPVSYEGIEQSPHILYSGLTQNQQIIPAALWSFYNLGKKFFLVGSEEIYSHAIHAIATQALSAVGGKVVGEAYIALASNDVTPLIQAIQTADPDVIINSIQGETNLAFFKALRAQGITPEKKPVMSVGSVSEVEF